MIGLAHHTPLLTRDAEGLFWMARYLERVENLARLIDVTQTFESPGREAESWAALVAINSDQAGLQQRGLQIDAANVKRFYLLDPTSPTGILYSIEAARTNARKLRPLISTEMWMQLNVFHGELLAIEPWELDGDALSRLCRRIKEGVQAHTGITEGTFFRDQGWHFYELGRLIERADQTTRLLDIKYHLLTPGSAEERRVVELTQWNALLRAAAGYHAFRRVAQAGFVPADVVAFLLGDTSFARSVALCVGQMEWHLSALRTRYGLRDTAPVLERIEDIRAALGAPVLRLLPDGLHDFLDGMQRDLGDLGELIGTMFFRDWRPLKQSQSSTQGSQSQSQGGSGSVCNPVSLCEGHPSSSRTRPRHCEPASARQSRQHAATSARMAWIASSQALLAMTISLKLTHYPQGGQSQSQGGQSQSQSQTMAGPWNTTG